MILDDLAQVEPLLRASCTHELDASRPLDQAEIARRYPAAEIDEAVAVRVASVAPAAQSLATDALAGTEQIVHRFPTDAVADAAVAVTVRPVAAGPG